MRNERKERGSLLPLIFALSGETSASREDSCLLPPQIVRMLKEGIVRFMIKEQNSACL